MARAAGAGKAGKPDRAAQMQAMRERAREQAREQQSGGNSYITIPRGNVDIDWLPLKADRKGKCRVSLYALPYESIGFNYTDKIEPGALFYKRTFYIHKIGPEEIKVICPAKTFGRRCPVCEDLNELMKDRDANEDTIKAYKAKQRELSLWYDPEAQAEELYLQDISYHLFGSLLNDEIEEVADDDPWFADPDSGVVTNIRYNEKSFGKATYFEAEKIDFELTKRVPPEWAIDHGYDLNAFLKEMTYDQIAAIYNGVAEEHDGEEQQREEQSARTRERSTRERQTSDQEPAAETRTRTRTRAEKEPEPEPEPAGDECPYGFTFGEDYGKEKRCRRCENADGCEKATSVAEPEPEPDKGDDSADGKCPEGLRYGHDCNTSNSCKKCKVWSDCDDLNEQLSKGK